MFKKIIADSGSSKTDWAVIHENGDTHFFTSEGLNPLFRTKDEINQILHENIHPEVDCKKINHVFFYGAGCGTEEKRAELNDGLSSFFAHASVSVNTDLLGAIHATCGNESGIVGILGTGSNSCLYNGTEIIAQVPSLGYILGDEGSGNHIGKLLLTKYLKKELPNDLNILFQQQYPYSLSNFLDNIYQKPYPNKFLASFAKFAIDNKTHPYIQTNILQPVLHTFFKEQICKYNPAINTPIHIVGSVAFHLQDELSLVAQQYNCSIDKIIKSPIENLAKYIHKNY